MFPLWRARSEGGEFQWEEFLAATLAPASPPSITWSLTAVAVIHPELVSSLRAASRSFSTLASDRPLMFARA